VRGQYDNTYKILLIGQPGSGKSAFLLRLTASKFSDDLTSTIGFEFGTRVINKVEFNIWDSSGNLRYLSLTRTNYRGANLFLVFIDLTDIAESIQYLNNLNNLIPEEVRCVLIFTKRDRIESEKMPTSEEMKKYKEDIAKNLGIVSGRIRGHYIISSKTIEDVEAGFHHFPRIIKQELAPPFNIRWDYLNGRWHGEQFSLFAKPLKGKESGHDKKGTPPLFNTKVTL